MTLQMGWSILFRHRLAKSVGSDERPYHLLRSKDHDFPSKSKR